tara:strand:+ start:425 stop:592 length:168 start_codon:yes stop_codon:yes gene_type:complete
MLLLKNLNLIQHYQENKQDYLRHHRQLQLDMFVLILVNLSATLMEKFEGQAYKLS